MLPDSLDAVLSEHSIKAIMCMHWGGTPCDVLSINDLGRKYDVPVIEDAAQAFGTEIDHTKIGNHSDYVCTSFQAIKAVTCGDGGALFMKDAETTKRARLMKWFGLDRELSSDMRCNQDPPEFGYKMHMNDIAAAIGLSNLKHVKGIIKAARCNATKYNEAFDGLSTVTLPSIPDNVDPSYWLYTIIVDNVSSFIAYMMNCGIACSRVHDRNDTKKIFVASATELPGVEFFDKHHVCIPVGWWLSIAQRDHIIESVKEYKDG